MIQKKISSLMGWRCLVLLAVLPIHSLQANDKIVARINDTRIPEKVLIAEINRYLPYASYHANVSRETFLRIRQKAMDNLIAEELLYQEALRRKLSVSDGEVRQQIERMKQGYPSEQAFENALKQSGISRKEVYRRIQRKLLIEKLIEVEVSSKIRITDEDLKAYYTENKHKFIIPERYKVRHILISVDPGAMREGWLEGLKKAENIYKLLLLGKDFAKIAREISDDTTSNTRGGDLGWFHQGQLLPELDRAIQSLKIGEITSPIRTIYGYHILRLEGKKPRQQLTYEEINKALLREKLRKKQFELRKNALIARLKREAKIEIYLD